MMASGLSLRAWPLHGEKEGEKAWALSRGWTRRAARSWTSGLSV